MKYKSKIEEKEKEERIYIQSMQKYNNIYGRLNTISTILLTITYVCVNYYLFLLFFSNKQTIVFNKKKSYNTSLIYCAKQPFRKKKTKGGV